jgi:hypothetical protein
VITLDANRDPSKRAVVLQIKGGKGVMVATIWPKGSAEEKAAAGAGSGSGSGSGSAAAEPAKEEKGAAPAPATPAPGAVPVSPAPSPTKRGAKSPKGGGARVMGDPDMGGE